MQAGVLEVLYKNSTDAITRFCNQSCKITDRQSSRNYCTPWSGSKYFPTMVERLSDDRTEACLQPEDLAGKFVPMLGMG
jgi:hypothetical protein